MIAIDLVGFLTNYARKIWIEADSIDHFLSVELAARSIGCYTDIVHIRNNPVEGAVTVSRYLFSDLVNRPWGNFLPMACPQCACLEPWSTRKVVQGGSIKATCTYTNCGKVLSWDKPEDAKAFSKDVGGKWFVITKKM